MKKVYSKPELYTVEYSTNTAFCGACSDKEKAIIDWLSIDSLFAADDVCEDDPSTITGEVYCKFTYSTKLMNS